MTSRFRQVFPQQESGIRLVTRPRISPTVAELESFALELEKGVGDNPHSYQLNVARLALADRHELLRRATPARDRGKLDACFNRFYSGWFDRKLKLERPDLSPPPVPVAQPQPEPPPRRKTTMEAMQEALADVF